VTEPSVSVEARDAIAPIAAEWDALARQVGASPFLWPGWFEAWLAAFAGGPPLVLTAWRERLAGVLIVRRRAGALLSPTNAHTPAFGMVADDPAVARALAHALFASGARTIALDHFAGDDPVLAEVADAAAGAGHAFVQRTLQRSPYATLHPGDDVDARIGEKRARNLRRFERRLRALGRVELEVADGRRQLHALLAEGFRLESSGWKAARGTAIASSPATRRFYSEVASWAAAAGILRLAFLRVDGRGVAFHFALEDASAYYLLKCGYEPEAGHCAPGRLLARAMFARALAGGLERFELLGGDDPWKREWAREHRTSVRVRAFRPTLLGKLDRAAQTTLLYGRPLAKRTLARVR
jgi:CelD/BcsL family acetyltransferase involved in cellulose biosynthesis